MIKQAIKKNGVIEEYNSMEHKNDNEITHFDSLNEFHKFVCETPINEAFRWADLSSSNGSKSFTETRSFEEANELFKNGWSKQAENLTRKLKVIESKMQPSFKTKQFNSVQGYQAIVPLYLNGCPTNMVNKKIVPVKQKVVTIVKSINYNWTFSTEEIINESIKCLQIIKKLENQGLRVNLDLILGTEKNKTICCRIRLKNSTEKVNVSKLAFPLVHPSMLRRLMFRFLETNPTTSKEFINEYGRVVDAITMKQFLRKDEILIPAKLDVELEDINCLEDLKK